MKKLSAVLLAVLMVLTCFVPMASAYDKEAVAAGSYDGMTNEDVLGVVLDWLDGKIKAATADFNKFEVKVMGQTIVVDTPEISGIDSLIQYKDHLADLDGDFKNLNTENLKGRTESGSDEAFVKNMIQFMADNADTFGKVFRWDDQVFDYGKVGEYIETLDANDPIRVFYNDYLVGGDIQTKFIDEIAREMGYTYEKDATGKRTETFDEIISNGIKAWALDTFGELLNAEGKAAVKAYDLRTTDVYALVKDFLYQVQNSNKAKLDDMLSAFMTAIQSSVAAIKNGINIEPPVLTIGHENNEAWATYHPADPNKENYMPSIYTNDQAYDMLKDLANEDIGVTVNKNSAMTDAEKALVAGDGEAWGEYFKAKATMGADELLNMNIKLSEAEEAVKTQVIDKLNETSKSMTINVPAMGETTVAFNISDAQATFSYKAYKDEANGSLAVQAKVESATAKVNVTSPITATADVDLMNPDATVVDWGSYATLISMAKSFGLDADKMIVDAIKSATGDMLKDPAFVTIIMTGLNGEIEDLAKVKELVNLIDTEAAYDPNVLDFFKDGRYDTYKGVAGQANRVFCDTLKMILSDEGYASLELVEGNNSNLHDNMQKLCNKVDGMMKMMKKYLSGEDFAALAAAAGLGDDFASSHGFNAGMIYNMDFSSVENLLVCAVRLGCDMIVEDNSGLLYDIHELVENDETLDAMFAHIADYFLAKAVEKINADEHIDFTYNYTAITGTDKNAVYDKLADIAYEAAAWAVLKANNIINNLIADLNTKLDLGIGNVNFQLKAEKGADWNATLANLVARFLDVTDGLIVYREAIDESDSALLKASKILNTVLPMTSMFSNTTNLVTIDGFIDNALNGNFGGLLSLFEVKEDAIAGDDISVTKALINASDYIVDAFFPDTVQAELYPQNETVQETFTGNESDQGIAARNMVSINANKDRLINAGCNLLKESDILKSLVCDHANVTTEDKAATCTETGWTGSETCATCGAVLSKGEEVPALGHNMVAGTPVAPTCTAEGYTLYTCANGCGTTEKKDIVPAKGHNLQLVDSKDATCTAAGYKKYECANGCGETKTETISAKGHSWGNWVVTKEATEDEEGSQTRTCSVCGATETQTIGKKSVNFFQRIINTIRGFFDRIVSWFRGIFSR